MERGSLPAAPGLYLRIRSRQMVSNVWMWYRSGMIPAVPDADFDCQTCGACCSYSSDWPRFSLESEADLARIPEALVSEDLGGMRCENDRCLALDGVLGQHVGCRIYSLRPIVCRTCLPGDDECLTARQALSGRVLLA